MVSLVSPRLAGTGGARESKTGSKGRGGGGGLRAGGSRGPFNEGGGDTGGSASTPCES